MFEIKNLSYSINGNTILSDISLKVDEGNCLCLFGKNGSGKTTLIRCIAGINAFQEGKIELFKVEQEDRKAYFGNLGCFFFDGLYDYLTVKENYTIFLSYYGINRKKVVDCMLDYVQSFELQDLLNIKVKELSAGQKQRVCLALLFMHNPKLLLFDEPLNNLDAYFIERFYEVLRAYLVKNNAMSIIINHHIINTPTWVSKIGLIEDQKLHLADNDKLYLEYFLNKIYQK